VKARAEAFERLGGAYEVRVLEPSPPAVSEPPWFADDPAARGRLPDRRTLVSPVSTGDLLWEDLARDDVDLALWCSERWLGSYRRLAPLPTSFVSTREALHRLAETLIAPSRERANGKIGLRFTRHGFGTPFFGADAQIRVESGELVVQSNEVERRAPITSLRAATALVGPELAPDGDQLDDVQLAVDRLSADALGDWYGFVTSALEQLRAEAAPELDASRVQIWPEHFDASVELGSEVAGERAGYGGSPGDDHHPEPYLYVTPWTAKPGGELWQAVGFSGAQLSYTRLLEAEDQRATALEFFRVRLQELASH
jgi:hypothetical protein